MPSDAPQAAAAAYQSEASTSSKPSDEEASGARHAVHDAAGRGEVHHVAGEPVGVGHVDHLPGGVDHLDGDVAGNLEDDVAVVVDGALRNQDLASVLVDGEYDDTAVGLGVIVPGDRDGHPDGVAGGDGRGDLDLDLGGPAGVRRGLDALDRQLHPAALGVLLRDGHLGGRHVAVLVLLDHGLGARGGLALSIAP